MKPIIITIGAAVAASILIVLLCGCVNIRHEAILSDGSKLVTSGTFFLATEKATRVSTSTRLGTNYIHSSSARELQSAGDVEFVKALAGLLQAAGMAAGKAAVAP
jgi:hypothetical protein